MKAGITNAANGVACTQADLCNGGCHTNHGRMVGVNIDTNRRSFTPLPRASKTCKREFAKRTAIERVNSWLDVSYGFENHYIGGQKKMETRVCLALIVMLSMALGWLEAGKPGYVRSLVGHPRAA